jgi:hypothetical protein
MSTVIGKVAAIFTASTGGLVTGCNTARAEFKKLEGGVDKLRGSVNLIAGIQGAQLFAGMVKGATNAARSIAAIGSATADTITEQARFAAKIGVPLESFRALAEAADEVGVGQGAVTTAVQKMGVALVAAGAGVKKAQSSFAALGLSSEELAKMAPEKAFERIVDEIAKLPTPAERTAAAMKIFGRTGKDLEPLFLAGSDAIRKATQEVNLFGTALDSTSGQNVIAMKNAFGDVADAFEGFKTQVVAAFAPAVTGLIEDLLSRLADAGGMVPVAMEFSKIMAVTVGTMVDGAMVFGKILMDAAANFNTLWNKVKGLGQAAYGVTEMVGAGLVGGAGMVAGVAKDTREGGVADAALDRADLMQREAGSLLNRAYANLFGSGDQGAGAPSAGGQFAARALEEIARMETAYKEREARMAAADTKAAEGVADQAAKQTTKQTALAEKSVTFLQDISKQIGLALGAPPAVFQITGAGSR